MSHPARLSQRLVIAAAALAVTTTLPLAPSFSRAADAADAPAPLLLNGDAESGKADQPSAWYPAAIPADGLKLARSDKSPHAGRYCLEIANTHKYPETVCNNWAQDLADAPAGRTLRATAFVRAADADAVNVCLQCWDATGERMLAFATTPVLRGDAAWTRVTTTPVLVPPGTARITLRAALTGTGTAWFDDLAVSDEPAAPAAAANPVAAAASPAAPAPPTADADFPPAIKARLRRELPVSKDAMALAYIPDWDRGDVDNLAVADNDGGVRTLLAFPKPDPADLADPGNHFVLAIYVRDVHGTPAGKHIDAYPVTADWNERVPWTALPRTAATPAATFPLVAPDVAPDVAPNPTAPGWRFLDLTPLLRQPDPAPHGVLLRFPKEDATASPDTWTGWAFASRECDQPPLRPRLLVLAPAK